ncbi:MAG: ATP-binding protein [Anaerolineaceae bacterium]|nr:ATP-binding protein [Anaerolineaceae bacterium]
MPLHTPFDEIDLTTLQRLVDDEVPEDRQLEYKRELQLNTKEQKREFLADVSAFANAEGGHLVIGIAEQNGVPIEADGIQRTGSSDEMLQQIQNLVRDGVEPNIYGINIKAVEVNVNRVVSIINIPPSWSKPHWVSLGGHRIFYSRNSNGKYPLDIPELRQLFTLSETATQRIKDYRAERIGAILAGETPVSLASGPKIVLHVISYNAGNDQHRVDLSRLSANYDFNFDGRFTGTSNAYYYQVFRDGSIEFVNELPMNPKDDSEFFASAIEEFHMSRFLPNLLELHKTLDVSPPLFLMLSLLNVGGYKMCLTEREQFDFNVFDERRPINKKHLLIPGIVMEIPESTVEGLMNMLQSAFDVAWQSSGFERSIYFNENRKLRGRRW